MRCLLDTHTYLWHATEPRELSRAASAVLEDESNVLCLSIASLWEIAIKMRVGKLRPKFTMLQLATDLPALYRFELIDITPTHLDLVSRLELHHRDPFDRLLVAQAIVENLPIISGDAALDRYGIARIW